MLYTVRTKVFPDGTRQMLFCDMPKTVDASRPLISMPDRIGKTVARKEIDNEKRAKSVVFDLARSNEWDYFITLTLDSRINRFDYDICCDEIKKFTKFLCRYGSFSWLIVPEQHQNGAWHFHGLVSGPLRLAPAVSPYTGKPLLDGSGRQVYNVLDFKAGFTTATKVSDGPRASSYLTKYFTKDMQIPKGKKRYWASRNLLRPQVFYDEIWDDQFDAFRDCARFVKEIPTAQWGNYVLIEIDGKEYST